MECCLLTSAKQITSARQKVAMGEEEIKGGEVSSLSPNKAIHHVKLTHVKVLIPLSFKLHNSTRLLSGEDHIDMSLRSAIK